MNIVVISGNLTKDTEYRSFDNGGVSSSSIAVSRDYKTKDGEKETDFSSLRRSVKRLKSLTITGKKVKRQL